jgi:hypothetical protein
MTIIDNDMLWHQFGAAIDEMGNALRECPDELWESMLWQDQPDQWVAGGFSSFWYLCYHALFWLDLYLTGAEEGYSPPEPFDLVEMQSREILPRTYTRLELLGYLASCRKKCQRIINEMTSEQARLMCHFPWGELPYAELQLYNLRHVQEHGAQLHMFLGQHAGKASQWVTTAK